MHAAADALSAIDHAIGTDPDTAIGQPAAQPGRCWVCEGTLRGSPSTDFCSEACQDRWHTERTSRGVAVDGGAAPDSALPDTTPTRELRWLGPPPPGVLARAGHEVLDEVCAFLRRFSVFPSQHCAPMLTLWYAHTHAAEHFYVTPRLILDSVEPGSGKTRVLEVAQHLVRAPEMTISATTAALFRMVGEGPITILFDEVDAVFNTKNGGNYEDLRAMLNAGYKRSATIARCVGDAKTMKVQRFPVYAPAALAGIASAMPATITTRAITIHMRRRAPNEHVEPFKERAVQRHAAPLRDTLAAWIDRAAHRLADAVPEMPDGVTDRAAEIWEPLITIADEAGGHWPATARTACTHFVTTAATTPASLGIRLLADLRALFTTRDTDRIPTTDILTALTDMDEAPWAELQGKPLDARRLGRLLGKYGVHSKDLRQPGGSVAKGYRTHGDDGLADAWNRYLPPAATAATCATPQVSPVADGAAVADTSATAAPEPP
jgi:Protein of unknown function (DUF3631)